MRFTSAASAGTATARIEEFTHKLFTQGTKQYRRRAPLQNSQLAPAPNVLILRLKCLTEFQCLTEETTKQVKCQ